MPDAKPEQDAYLTCMNMLAVQLVSQLPGNRRDADYVLERVRKILDEVVYEERLERPPIKSSPPQLSVVPGSGRAS